MIPRSREISTLDCNEFPKPGLLARSCAHEILGLGRKESSFDHTRDPHSRRCYRVSHHRAARANARGLLGCDRDIGRHAIHSWRDADTLVRADRSHCRGRVSRSARGKFFWRKPRRIRGRNRSHRIALDRVSSGEDRISLRKHYPRHHRSDSAFGSGVDYRVAQVS